MIKKKLGFPENATVLTLLSKVPPYTVILVHIFFFKSTIGTPTVPAYHMTLTYDQYLFKSKSNMQVNLILWNSLHPKKAIYLLSITTFSR